MLNTLETSDKGLCKYQLIAFILQHVIIALLFILQRSETVFSFPFFPVLPHTGTLQTEEGTCPAPTTLPDFETRYDSKYDKQREGRMGRGQ